MTTDGWSLDDKRNPLLPLEKLGPSPKEALAEGEHEQNSLPDCLSRWRQRKDSERERERTAKSFCVPKEEIAPRATTSASTATRSWCMKTGEHRPPLEKLQGIEELEGGGSGARPC